MSHLGMTNLVDRLPRAGKVACAAISQVLIVVCCVQEMFQLGWVGEHGVKPPQEVMQSFWVWVLIGLFGIAGLTNLTGDRLFTRTDERNKGLYTGTKQHLYRRG